jgi:tRNA modification GTPase
VNARADTIAAVATPPGQGGVAIIRVSGPDALTIVRARITGAQLVEPRRVYVARALAAPGGATLDQVLVFSMPGPHSFTGEDVVEIQCHGGSVVSRRILESVLTGGARAAEPGEFSKRAFLNGRIDLAQAEAIADLIAAQSDAGMRLAWSQLEGALSTRVETLRSAIVEARALCEAAIDFPDEELPEIGDGRLAGELGRVRSELTRLIATFERARVRYQGARVAMVGKPNVGKSSLLNVLAGRERSIVTPIPGTTRDVVEVVVAIAGIPVVLADTAGIRDSADTVERLGVDRSLAATDDAAVVLAVFDHSRPLDGDDAMVATAARVRPAIAVLNKSDLPATFAPALLAGLLPDARVVEVSAITRSGLDELGSALANLLVGGDEAEPEVAMYRARHHDAARRAVDDLERAEAALAANAPPELIASDLDAAAAALAGITGEISSEDVLDRVFAEFCIGK